MIMVNDKYIKYYEESDEGTIWNWSALQRVRIHV
jgi:hypothetical protein